MVFGGEDCSGRVMERFLMAFSPNFGFLLFLFLSLSIFFLTLFSYLLARNYHFLAQNSFISSSLSLSLYFLSSSCPFFSYFSCLFIGNEKDPRTCLDGIIVVIGFLELVSIIHHTWWLFCTSFIANSEGYNVNFCFIEYRVHM